MRWLILLFIAVVCSQLNAFAAGPDDDYVKVYQTIQEADQLRAAGRNDLARAKYLEAQAGLKKLQESFPNWNTKVVQFRQSYVNERLEPLLKLAPAPVASPATSKPAEAAPAKPAAGPKTVVPDQRDAEIIALKDANRQLQAHNTVLTEKLREALAAQPAAVDPRELKKAEEKILALEKERDVLQATLKKEQTPTPAEADSRKQKQLVDSLREENDSLRKQLAQRSLDKTLETSQKKWEQERKALQAKVEEAEAAAAKAESSLQARIKNLEGERRELAAKLNEASKRKPAPPAKNPAPGMSAAELASMRARLEVLEARKVPYTKEELALFKAEPPPGKPSTLVAEITAPVEQRRTRASRELPAGASALVAEAQRAALGGRFDEAEAKFQEVLKMDENNFFTLTRLASVQLERGAFDRAEATLKKAQSVDSEDAYLLTLLGILNFRTARYDAAFDYLSRALQLDPENPETHNYLGITLNERGQRAAGEAALRKAIQLSPGYASAHSNLAVVYATQTPPFLELARYHYQKALAAGHSANPEIEKLINREQPAPAK